jgi:hypothetical protein
MPSNAYMGTGGPGLFSGMMGSTAPTTPTTQPSSGGPFGNITNVANALAPASRTAGATSGTTYSLPNGGTSPYNPVNNYANSGMSQDAYESMYGSPSQQAAAGSAAGAAGNAAGIGESNNPAVNPYLASGTSTPTYGTQSGPGILQQWFNSMATGTNPAYEYSLGRGETALNNQYAARGGFDSGAALQGQSDLAANLGAQNISNLDTLAQGASNEYQNQLSTMLGLGTGLSSGESGLAGQYDTGAATDLTNANNTGLSLAGQSAMIPYLANQALESNLSGLLGKLFGS